MPSIRSILVHFDAQPACVERLQVARRLAEQHGACVTAVYAVPPSFSQVPYSADVSPAALAAFREIDDERLRQAFGSFEAAMKEPGPHARWVPITGVAVFSDFVHAALFADLLVLGQRPPGSRLKRDMPADFAESVVIASGKPAIIVPRVVTELSPGHRVVVAWKATREAMRAVTAAFPLLQRADQVHLAHWSEAACGPQDFAAIEHHLRLHDIEAVRHEFGRSEAVGEAMLALVSEVAADMLVMGCYGHARWREFVLGGATRTVLQSMTVPVLLAH